MAMAASIVDENGRIINAYVVDSTQGNICSKKLAGHDT
jgi:hypothetical protein